MCQEGSPVRARGSLLQGRAPSIVTCFVQLTLTQESISDSDGASSKRRKLYRRINSSLSGSSGSSGMTSGGPSSESTSSGSMSSGSTTPGSTISGITTSGVGSSGGGSSSETNSGVTPSEGSTSSDDTVNSIPSIHSETPTEYGGPRLYTHNSDITKLPTAFRPFRYWYVGRRYYASYRIQCLERQWVLNCSCAQDGRVQCRGFRRQHIGRPDEWQYLNDHEATAISREICHCMHDQTAPPTSPRTKPPPRPSRKASLSISASRCGKLTPPEDHVTFRGCHEQTTKTKPPGWSWGHGEVSRE